MDSDSSSNPVKESTTQKKSRRRKKNWSHLREIISVPKADVGDMLLEANSDNPENWDIRERAVGSIKNLPKAKRRNYDEMKDKSSKRQLASSSYEEALMKRVEIVEERNVQLAERLNKIEKMLEQQQPPPWFQPLPPPPPLDWYQQPPPPPPPPPLPPDSHFIKCMMP